MKKKLLLIITVCLILMLSVGCDIDAFDIHSGSKKTFDVKTGIDILDGTFNKDDNEKEPEKVADDENNNNNEDENNDSSTETIETKIDKLFKQDNPLRKKISSEDMRFKSTDTNSDNMKQLLVTSLLKENYKVDTLDKAKYKTLNTLEKQIDNSISIKIEELFAQFDNQNSIKGLNKIEGNTYTDKFYLMSYTDATDTEKYTHVLDICFEKDLTYDEVMEYAIKSLEKDTRMANRFDNNTPLYVNGSNTDENQSKVTTMSINKLMPDYIVYDMSYNNTDNIIYALMSKPKKISDKNNLICDFSLCKLSTATNELVETKQLGTHEYVSKLDIDKANTSDLFKITFADGDYSIKNDGTIAKSTEVITSKLNSPDGKYETSIDEKGNLCIKNIKTENVVITIENTKQDEITKPYEYNSFKLIQWIDDERLAYTMNGQDFINGIGILNVCYCRNDVLENTKDIKNYEIKDDKLYVTVSSDSEQNASPFKLGYYDLSKSPYEYTAIYDADEDTSLYNNLSDISKYYREFSSDYKYLYVYGIADKQNNNLQLIKYDVQAKNVIDTIEITNDPNMPNSTIIRSMITNDNRLVYFDNYHLYVVNVQ